MLDTILEFWQRNFTLESPNVTYYPAWIFVALVWLAVVACTLSSIRSRPFRRRAKIVWSLVVVLLPLFGLLAYLPFSLNEELFPYIGFWRKPRR